MAKRRFSVSQLVILGCVVVALVFLVTYTSILSGSMKPPTGDPKPSAGVVLLQFPVTEWPPTDPSNPDAAEVSEWHVDGHHVFWFDTTGNDPVRVRLYNKNCKCTRVEVATFPEELKNVSPSERDKYRDDPKLTWQVLDRDDSKGVEIPAHSSGGVRLTWKGEKLGKEKLVAELATEAGSVPGPLIALNMSIDLVPALLVNPEDDLRDPLPDNEIVVDTLRAGDVRTVNVLCWSATRPNFSLKVEQPPDPCVRCGAPQRLTKEQCAELSKRDSKQVEAAYRIPVTVMERTPDGAQFELGRFRRHIHFTSDPGIDDTEVAIGGTVRGDITVGNPDDRDMVLLGSFERGDGRSKSIPVTTPDRDLELAIDQVPDFLKVTLEEEKGQMQLGKVWTLTVTVPPDGLSGPTPPHTAIYLKTKGKHPRRIRVPVIGNAYVR
jgi:hypothetical protein